MTRRRRKGSIVRGNKIYVLGSPPPRWKPPIESIPVDYVSGTPEGSAEDEWLPDENDDVVQPDEVGGEAAALAFLDEVLDEVLGSVGEVDGDDNDANGIADAKEPQW